MHWTWGFVISLDALILMYQNISLFLKKYAIENALL